MVVFDEKTLDVDTTAWFEIFNNASGANAFAQLINSIPANKLVALGVSGDAKNNNYPQVSNAVLSLGGTRFPELKFKAPYALFGKKGADSTQVKQSIKNPFEGPLQLDTTEVKTLAFGSLVSNQIGPSSEWKKLKVSQTNQNDSEIKFRPLGIKHDGIVDTLPYLSIVNNEADLSMISANTYPYIKLQSEFKADSLLNSPQLSKLEVNYNGIAEVGTNYQAVKTNKDTLEQGEQGRVSFHIYNSGEAAANNFQVQVEVIRPDNSSESILEQYVSSLAPGEEKYFETVFSTNFEAGNRTYKISVDSANQVFEYYKDNNIYTVPFFIKADTTITSVSETSLNVTYDGVEIQNGDYISSKPLLSIILNYPVWFPIEDTTAVEFYLNQNQIYYNQLNIQHDTSNKRIIYQYSPNLLDGEYTLRIFGINVNGEIEDSPGYEKYFLVTNEAKLINIYNYPNPVKDNTYFTFRLTQVPDEIKIMVYTIAGRLVKEIVKTRSELTTDFNKIFWDCRDEDGDLLGNGTYLYKVIMNAGEKTETSVNKLAIVR